MAFKRQFGKVIPGLIIHGEPADYPILNERDVRAAAGVMLVLGFFAFSNALFLKQFQYLQAFVILFFMEFAIRLWINPYYAPIYAFGKALVSNQRPELVGAIQKKFAWYMGLALATAMIFVAIIFQIRGALPFSLCSICLFFLWAESTLGICIGCKIYGFLKKKGFIKSKVQPACGGGVCQIKLPIKQKA